MARTKKHGPFLDVTITRMEGLLQELRDMVPRFKPRTTTNAYLAQHLGVTAITVKKWRAEAAKSAKRDDNAELFGELYSHIADELCESLMSTAFNIAHDPGNQKAFAVIQWLLPQIDPDNYGAEVVANGEREYTVADMPQEIFDALSDTECDELDRLQRVIDDAMRTCETMLKHVQRRLLDKAIVGGDAIH